MRSFRHWSPAYVVARLRFAAHRRRHPDAPWLTDGAVAFLDQWLRPSDVAVEWGSGRSTSWLAARVRRLISVEHDPTWFSEVTHRLGEADRDNVDQRLVDHEARHESGAPCYVHTLRSEPDHSVDFVLVDGKHRDLCAVESLRLLRPGGLLVLDNANLYLPTDSPAPNSLRTLEGLAPDSSWRAFRDAVKGWRCIWTTNGVSDTAIWFCPCPAEAP